jgi:hypothetical protein
MLKLRVRVTDLRDGIYYGFPLCCVLRYVLAWRLWGQAMRRGVYDPEGNPRVPCNIFHHGSPPHTLDFGEACEDHG